ncbi:indole-3-glycerol phosphate synthase TrpC [Paenibacillus bovis]|uniref:Indole-3-glycerol phosphate synthase n=1 Tax=Paenibacillus bovis TaxID=1616788 RepID=A0A172ZIN2_9BACL|nr:indole-3-glycerol phosphate synthase TrpC [Paenibacillus bovis]ANF97448.1 indole-3-glycerol phosphate synthase [Paenibacillus bovis]
MYLDRIVVTKQGEVEQLASRFSLADAERRIADMPATRGFRHALTSDANRNVGLIAEVKKASPSKGLIRPDFDPVNIARAYEQAGADCISVLTDVQYFQGNDRYLTEIHEAIQLPLLRKDFIIDERQIYEARLIGADAILLIAAILTPAQIRDYLAVAVSLGLDVLIEVHDRHELEIVLAAPGATEHGLIGVNNRDLKTFETSLSTTAELIRLLPEGVPLISESGIMSPDDIRYVAEAGAAGVLVGEYFMRQEDIAQAVRTLMEPVQFRKNHQAATEASHE